MSNNKVVLIGYSGHGLVVADAALKQGLNLLYYTEKTQVERNPYNLEYLGFECDPDYEYWNLDHNYALAIGNNAIRLKAANTILKRGKKLVNVIHPRSSVSENVEMGVGNFINACAALNALAALGNYCIVNTGAILEHECHLGNAVHVAPGAVLAGGVEVGDNTFIGANSIIKEGVHIGENVIIGAGSVILNNVADNERIVGNPGRKI